MFCASSCFSEIKELYESPSMKDVEPISGYLSFPAGTSLAYIPISSIDDNEEEADDVFSVRLISAKGGARVSENDAAAILTGTHILILSKPEIFSGHIQAWGRCQTIQLCTLLYSGAGVLGLYEPVNFYLCTLPFILQTSGNNEILNTILQFQC